jgi:hypothetical protein
MRTAVFITVDTEVWPHSSDWRATDLASDMERDIYGVTPQGEYGLRYQLDVLDAFGLKAVFFVESLFASAVGPGRLTETVELIRTRRHDVQLHLHPEWLQWMAKPTVLGKHSQFLKDFTEDEQASMIKQALANLQDCGADSVCAFRAGNYGANFDTLRALKRNGIGYDTSYNFTYLSSQCGMKSPEPLLQAQEVEGVVEYPITFFEDWPGHYRHLQITACSFGEMKHALLEARRRGWSSVVLVSHSFELLKNRKSPRTPLLPDQICVRRFEQLCRFLAEHPDQFRTATFSELGAPPTSAPKESGPLKSNMLRTARRHSEQLLRLRRSHEPPRAKRVGILGDGEDTPAVQPDNLLRRQPAEQAQVVLLGGCRSARPQEFALRTVPVQEERRGCGGFSDGPDFTDRVACLPVEGQQAHL